MKLSNNRYTVDWLRIGLPNKFRLPWYFNGPLKPSMINYIVLAPRSFAAANVMIWETWAASRENDGKTELPLLHAAKYQLTLSTSNRWVCHKDKITIVAANTGHCSCA